MSEEYKMISPQNLQGLENAGSFEAAKRTISDGYRNLRSDVERLLKQQVEDYEPPVITEIYRAQITAVNASTLTCTINGESKTVYPIHKMANSLTGDVTPKYTTNDYLSVFKSGDTWYTVVPFADTIEFE
jgi:hypothetical protein